MSGHEDYGSADEARLLAGSRSGDMEAFEELVARHRDKVYSRALMMMRQEDDALEISQEAWVRVWQRLALFHGDSSFATWVTRITINLCLDRLRQQKRHTAESIEQIEAESGGIENQMPVVVPNPTENLERQELRDRIEAAMDKLSPDHRAVLLLHEFEGLEYKEIARRVGCSLGTVMSRLFYARRRLAALLGGMNREELR